MNKMLVATFCLICCGIALKAQNPARPARQYAIVIPESKVEFFVGSSVGDVKTFSSWKGEFKVATPGVPESAALTLDLVAASMTTGNGAKDKMVKGKDFFYVEKYPAISFTSTKVIPSTDPNKFQVLGDFTLRGVTKNVSLQVTLDRDSKGFGQIYADLSFDRRDFVWQRGAGGFTFADAPSAGTSDAATVLQASMHQDTAQQRDIP